MKNPTFSIVIASYNFGQFIEQAIQSVINQSYKNYELIIIDGGSSDNTVDIIRKYDMHITYWVSEKDNGQSDAFNKGFKKSSGEFFFWLNADDVIMPGSLEYISNYIKKYPNYKWFAANTIFFDENNKILRARKGPEWITYLIKEAPIYVYGPTTIFHKDLYIESKGFDESLSFTMDTDLWMRFVILGYKFKRVDKYVWGLRVHDNSKTSHAFSSGPSVKFLAEQNRIAEKNKWIIDKKKLWIQKIFKIISGVYINSFVDSIKLKNKTIK
jgi:glycosyltransferase involved in cell wall biosynthesis